MKAHQLINGLMKVLKIQTFMYLVCLLLTSTSLANETSQTVRGFVYDQATNSPIPGVKVLIVGSNPKKGTFTDDFGAFEITDVPIGRHDLSFSFLGYSTFIQREVRFDGGEETILEIYLTENTRELGEVVVTSDQRKVRNEGAIVSARSLSVEELSRIPGSLDDPARMARKFPGVAPSPYITTNEIAIRGNASRAVLWRLDDIDIYNPNHFGLVGGSGGSLTLLVNDYCRTQIFILELSLQILGMPWEVCLMFVLEMETPKRDSTRFS